MMKSYRAPSFNASIADGFADDCDELIHRCLQSETLNYHVFCNIWKDMNFALVFQGRYSGPEVAELSEEFLYIAKRYMVANTSNYEESVAGLFLVYALVHLQPYSGFAPLRITPADLDALHCIRDIARKQRRHDVLYILGSLLVEGPVEFHIAERQHGLEKQLRQGFDVPTSLDKLGLRPKGVFFRQNEELDLLRELASLGRRYTRAKALVTGTSKPDRTLSYVNEHMASELSASLKQLINGNEDEAPPTVDHHDRVQSIKHRAMADTVSQMKHLMSVEARKKADDGASTSKLDIRTRPGKVKTGSPTKPPPTSSPKKRRAPNKRGSSNRKRRPNYESSDSSDEGTFVPSGDSDDDVSSEKDSDVEDFGTIDDVLDRVKDRQKKVSEIEVPKTIDDVLDKRRGIREEIEIHASEEVGTGVVIDIVDDDFDKEKNQERKVEETEVCASEEVENGVCIYSVDDILNRVKNRERKVEEIEMDVSEEIENRIVIEVAEETDSCATDENATSQSIAELIIPDYIPDKDERKVKSKGSRSKRSGLKSKKKKLKLTTESRLRSLGILSVVEKNQEGE